MSIRYNTMASTYTNIANEHFESANNIMDEYKKLDEERKQYKYGTFNYEYIACEMSEKEMQRNNAALVCIVFVCMSLEAFIYDYSARNFSDTYVKKYLDKMDLVSKYLIVPKLICGKEINKEGKAFQLLREVIRLRNKIVHTKSETCESFEDLKQKVIKSNKDYLEQAGKSLELIKLLSSELDKIDTNANSSFYFGISRNLCKGDD